jgi:hypothetical protein
MLTEWKAIPGRELDVRRVLALYVAIRPINDDGDKDKRHKAKEAICRPGNTTVILRFASLKSDGSHKANADNKANREANKIRLRAVVVLQLQSLVRLQGGHPPKGTLGGSL